VSLLVISQALEWYSTLVMYELWVHARLWQAGGPTCGMMWETPPTGSPAARALRFSGVGSACSMAVEGWVAPFFRPHPTIF
jgi:hypothetical protein